LKCKLINFAVTMNWPDQPKSRLQCDCTPRKPRSILCPPQMFPVVDCGKDRGTLCCRRDYAKTLWGFEYY